MTNSHGWLMVFFAFLAMLISSGTVLYSYSVIAVPLGEAFEASRMTMMLGMTAMTLAGGALSPFLGAMIDRGSLRAMMMLGAVATAVGYTLLSVTTAPWQVLCVYALPMALGLNLLGPLTTSTLLARWFVERRGLALGLAAIGTSVGGFVFPPLVQWLIDQYEWRAALRVLALICLLVTLPAAFFVVNRPADRDRKPDPGSAPGGHAAQVPAFSSAALLRDRNFWTIAGVMSLLFAVYTALLANLVPFARGVGVGPEQAAFLVSAIALAGIVGKLVFGAIADYVDLRLGLAVAMLLIAAGLGCYTAGDGYRALLAGSACIGLAAGGMLPVWGALLAAVFGAMNYGRVMGIMNPVMLPMTLVAPPLAGYIYDTSGSYGGVFVLFLAVLLCGLLVLPLIRQPAPESAAPREA